MKTHIAYFRREKAPDNHVIAIQAPIIYLILGEKGSHSIAQANLEF